MATAAAPSLIAVLAASGLLLGGVGAANASTRATGFFINGAGFGHGVGMSQYGAAGYAEHGDSYRQILHHYYEGTTLGRVTPSHRIRVLLKPAGASFRGSDTQLGPRMQLKPAVTYSVRSTGRGLLVSNGAHLDGVWKSPLIVRGAAPLDVPGLGRYRGALEFVQSGSAVETINVVGIEDYVRGVVAAEMPAGWPSQALEAQAVAARTFAVATGAVNKLFNVYDDTRSQVYRGVSSETPASDAAVAATSGQIVEYGGVPALTYFFSSSGGYTESVQNVWQGVEPEAWLRGVPDPYDDSFDNPYFRWKETLSLATASGDLKPYLKGALKGVEILRHGVSPRIVRAAVVGSKGTVDVTGDQLETLLRLRSTYASFTTITSRGVVDSGTGTGVRGGEPAATPVTATVPARSGGAGVTPSLATTATPATPTGGAGTAAASARRRLPLRTVQGSAYPAAPGTVVHVQRLRGGGWRNVGSGRLTATGTYSVAVARGGRYRIVLNGIDGPSVTVS